MVNDTAIGSVPTGDAPAGATRRRDASIRTGSHSSPHAEQVQREL
jgi:hypothetical protein